MMLELDPLSLFFLVIITAVVVVGLLGNGFITIANGYSWIRSKTLSPSDMILTALSLSRLLFLGLTLTIHCSFFIDLNKPNLMPTHMIFLWAFLNALCTWVATCLATFYCMKIINFTQPFLVKMKLSISGMVPHLLLASVLTSLVTSLPFIFIRNCYTCCNITRILLSGGNETCLVRTPQTELSSLLYISGTSLSFIIFLICSVFLIHSVLHHIKRLRRNTGGFGDQRMEVHMRAVKTFISFLILYSATFASMITLTLFPSILGMVISKVVVTAYHSGHAVILVVTNPKLKEALGKVLCDTMGQHLRKTVSSSFPKTSEGTPSS